MKKIIFSLALLTIIMSGCDNNTDDFNNNQDAQYDVSPEVLFTNAQVELANQMTTPSVNLNPFRFFSQYWAQTTYNDETRYRLTTRAVADNHWNNLYRNVLGNLQSAKDLVAAQSVPAGVPAGEWQINHKNQLAIIEILQVYTFQVLVDSFGDIPYSQALNTNILLPVYDDDAAIYPQLITRLNNAIADLDESGESWVNSDVIYNGDVGLWHLFANSLKVKLGINLADVNPGLAQSTIESAFAAGVILNNSQNATFEFSGSAPNYNPLYGDLEASNRNDFVAADTFINSLTALDDPRIAVYFNDVEGQYIGGIYGAANNNYASFSQIGDRFRAAGLPSELFEASEVNFYLAEAAARGYSVGNTAEHYYNEGIRMSFEYWGLPATEAEDYLAMPEVAFATASTDWREMIGMQEWVAFYNRPFESWNSYRRLDFPQLQAPTNAVAAAEGEVPKRLPYPVSERTVNNAQYVAASAAIGGDKMITHVFWDVD
ncbi:MAG TPA: SusD/RagB family nutrient-binding outer membrane lipoprotein [Flavobacterium sp.]|jgi:hypothetical protein